VIPAAVSVALFYSGFFSFIFAVPVQYAFSRNGRQRGVATAAVAVGLFVVFHGAQALRVAATSGIDVGTLVLDVLMPISFVAALAVMNMLNRLWWQRLLIAGALAVVGALPGLLALLRIAETPGTAQDQLLALFGALGLQQDWRVLLSFIRQVLFSTLGFGLTAAVAINWWIGRSMVLRARGEGETLRHATVPDQFVWVVIVGLAGVVYHWLSELGVVGIVGWNVLLLGGFFFAVQGMGIIQFLLHRRGVGEYAQRMVLMGALIGMILPGLNIVVSGGLPLVGISEVWIDYKRGEYNEGHIEQ
jgi:hypothetical protein